MPSSLLRRSRSARPARRFNKTIQRFNKSALRFNKTIRRSASTERWKNNVSEKVGEGGFGIVSRPPARCHHFFSQNSDNINQRNINSVVFKNTYYKNPKYISKLTEYTQAANEIQIATIIKDNIEKWRDYYCLIEFICAAPVEKHVQISVDDYLDTYAIAPYCGVTLKNILDDKIYISVSECCNLLKGIARLITGIGELHKIYIYHQDIWDENVLFSLDDKYVRLIDFGMAIDIFSEYKVNKNEFALKKVGVELTESESIIFNIVEPVLVYIKNKLESSRELTNATRQCLRTAVHMLDKIPYRPGDNDYPSNKKSKLYHDFINKINNIYTDFIVEFLDTSI